MPKQIKTCRVCGATYEACNSARSGSSVFNWREVACSPECGMVYLDQVVASRNATNPEKEASVARPGRKKKIEKPEPEIEQVVKVEEFPADAAAELEAVAVTE